MKVGIKLILRDDWVGIFGRTAIADDNYFIKDFDLVQEDSNVFGCHNYVVELLVIEQFKLKRNGIEEDGFKESTLSFTLQELSPTEYNKLEKFFSEAYDGKFITIRIYRNNGKVYKYKLIRYGANTEQEIMLEYNSDSNFKIEQLEFEEKKSFIELLKGIFKK